MKKVRFLEETTLALKFQAGEVFDVSEMLFNKMKAAGLLAHPCGVTGGAEPYNPVEEVK